MESLNMNTLANSLQNPNSTGLQNAEKDLLNDFKAAALGITTLYRSSRKTSKRAYNVGYAAACQDLMLMLQQGVSVGAMEGDVHGGMSIGNVMDWIEARLDAIKSREEEEDEEEEREKARTSGPSVVPQTSSASTSKRPAAQTQGPVRAFLPFHLSSV
ncbi:hypothetical protein BDV98DRAFT_516718 [Pterulicium gracile]|uniref:Uncharacterized protein n=1 Tax=Pterulicium gracile TaxID=1884261 RepID=A0A5C3Q353_9AGAR|nr:hypothetical protein BDV98DRAFT_516718 [Pterula gracilis]